MATPAELEYRTIAERSRAYRGRAKVPIHILLSESDSQLGSRPLDPKNVARLLRIFQLEGCFRLEPEHHVPALINGQVLAAVLNDARLQPGNLMTCDDPPKLNINVPLLCLHGKHRLKAANEFLDPHDKWWIVDLYLDDIEANSKATIREEYSNSRNFCDGDIFRNLRFHQQRNNANGAGKWLARLSESKRRDVTQLQKMANKFSEMTQLSVAFDKLLPYVGLWSALQLGTFHRLLTLKCPEELAHYLNHIHKTWFLILDCREDLMPCLDANTVRLLQTRCLSLSSEDRRTVQEDMQNGVLFPTITHAATRQRIWYQLNTITHMIPSIYTFLEDTKYLEPCAKVMKCLLPAKFKGSIRQAFRQHHTGQTQCQIQVAEYSFSDLSSNLDDCIWKVYLQIWLFEMRHFPEMIGISPRKDDGKPKPSLQRPDDNLWHRIAKLALNSGFDSSAIRQYVGRDPDVKMASEFLRQCRPTEHYNFDETVFSTEVERIATTLRAVKARNITLTAPLLSFDGQGDMSIADRCGRPFEQSFLDDRKYLFINYIYDTSWGSLSPDQLTSLRQRHLTSFKVKQDIFHAFFGNSLESAPAQQMTEATLPPDQMTGVETFNRQCATESPGPSSNQVPLCITYPSALSTSTCNASDNVQLASETTMELQNDMQLDLPQPQVSSEMVEAHHLPEPAQIHVLEPIETLMKKASAPPGSVGSSGIIGARPVSATTQINIPETPPEPLQITNVPHDNAQEASPGKTLPGTFPATSIQPLETNERSSENFHLLTVGRQVWPKERTVRELMDIHASRQLCPSKPLLLYKTDTREYQYDEPKWARIHEFVMNNQNKGIKLQFMYIDPTEQLQCCSAKVAFENAIRPPSSSRFMLFQIQDPKKNFQGRKLADLDSPVTQKVRAIEDLGKFQGQSFTEFRG